jgi:hypothetical protein
MGHKVHSVRGNSQHCSWNVDVCFAKLLKSEDPLPLLYQTSHIFFKYLQFWSVYVLPSVAHA